MSFRTDGGRRLLLTLCLGTAALASRGSGEDLPALPKDWAGAVLPASPAAPGAGGTLPIPAAPPAAAIVQAGRDAGDERPDYSALTQNLFHFPDFRLGAVPKGKLPYLSVTNTTLVSTSEQHIGECQRLRAQHAPTDPRACPQIEWSVPYSLDSASVTAARNMRAAWQRFEDRYYWSAMIELNNPVLYAAQCLLDVSSGLTTTAPQLRVTVAASDFPRSGLLDGRLPLSSPENELHLDSYLLPWPQTPSKDFCTGINLNLLPEVPLMYLPGTCFTVFGTPSGVCIEGNRSSALNPLAPAPIYFNTGEAQRRVEAAVKRSVTTYAAEYQADIVKALFDKENRYFFPLPWNSLLPGRGAVIAPLMSDNIDPSPFGKLATFVRAQMAGDRTTALYALNSAAYYFQSIFRSPTLSLHTLPGRHDVLGSPPGVWAFEEFKRTLPPTTPTFQEQMGYTTFFQAFERAHTTTLPEPLSAKVLRPIVYYATGVLADFPSGATVPLPQPMLVTPYQTGLPFAGLQAEFDWKSVPEGYQIPRVQGQPLFDYGPVVK